MDILDVHNDLLFLANKERNFWPSETIDATLHRAQMIKFNEAARRYAIDQEAQDDVSPFKVTQDFTTSNTSGGVITIDPDYTYLRQVGLNISYYDNAQGKTRYFNVEVLNETQLPTRLDSQLEPVELTSPIATIKSASQIQLHPKTPNTGTVYFLREPKPPKLAYSMNGRKFEYNANNSTQMEWNNTCMTQIIMKALQLLGVNIESDRLSQYAEIKDQQKV